MSQEFYCEDDHAEMVANWIAEHGGCERCAEFDEVHDAHCPNHPDHARICPHGMPLAENICGPCSKGQPNRAPDQLTEQRS